MERIREIRSRLRLAMNGVISESMRAKGMVYKLNFGVPIPEIRQIAAEYEPDAKLAEAMWKEDVRELKILATMLHPATIRLERAANWVREIPYLEIAEQCARNLFGRLCDPEPLLYALVAEPETRYARTTAFLVWTELFKAKKEMSPALINIFLVEARQTLAGHVYEADWAEKQAAVKALKFYGRQSAGQAKRVLDSLEAIPDFGQTMEEQEIYNDLKFEFDYYQ